MRKKQQLTITLPPEILEKVDSVINNSLIRNRSQAIESLINEGYTQKVETAVILSGGDDKQAKCKVLKKVNGEHLLSIMIGQLKMHGIKNIVLCAGDCTKSVQDIFKDGSNWGIKIEYVHEKKPLKTGGILLKAKDKIAGNNFLVLYGDILTNMNFKDFIEFHFSEGNLVTMGVKPRMGENKYGQVLIQGNSVVGYSKKEVNAELGLINTGTYIFSKQALEIVPKNKLTGISTSLIPNLIQKKQLSAFMFQGIWYDISARSDFEKAVAKWK